MIGPGRINGWICDKCHEVTYAIHLDEGVTPFYLGCRVTDGCKGLAESLFYPDSRPPPHVIAEVKWEWYEPNNVRYQTLNENEKDHVDKGGLLIRELTEAGRKLLEAI